MLLPQSGIPDISEDVRKAVEQLAVGEHEADRRAAGTVPLSSDFSFYWQLTSNERGNNTAFVNELSQINAAAAIPSCE